MDKKQVEFGTDGIRGRVGKVLTPEIAYGLGWSVGKLSGGTVYVGCDTRESGDMLVASVISGLLSSGIDAVNVGTLSTPTLIFGSYVDLFSYGIMVTASHNPFYDNGLKVIGPKGNKIDRDAQVFIQEHIYGDHDCSVKCGRLRNSRSLTELYRANIVSKCRFKLKGLKVVLDVANGSTYSIAPDIFQTLGAQTYVVNDKPTGRNINEKCGSTGVEHTIASLKNRALSYDIGFSFDGDGDRVIAFLPNGDIIDGDRIIKVLVAFNQPSNVVLTVMSDLGIISDIEGSGCKVHLSKVGDKSVCNKMIEHSCRFGGERSGHIIDSDYLPSGDGLYIALLLADYFCENPELFLNAVKISRATFRFEKNIRCNDPKTLHDALSKIKSSFSYKDLKTVIRPSGTEPVLRIMVQGFDQKKVEECSRRLLQEAER